MINQILSDINLRLRLWKYVEDDFWKMTGGNIRLSLENILFGFRNVDGLVGQNLNLLNHLILIAKMCISKFKKLEICVVDLIVNVYEFEKSLRLNGNGMSNC